MENETDTPGNFAAVRCGDAQVAMRSVLGKLESEPFAGSRLLPGQVPPEFDDIPAAVDYYRGALEAYLITMGAVIKAQRPSQDTDYLHTQYGAEPQQKAPPVDVTAFAPSDLIVFGGKVPATSIQGGRKASAQIIEACAELMRIVLVTAVIAAAEDADLDEEVIVWFRQVELGGKTDFLNGHFVGLIRVQALVYRAGDPKRNYLLGSVSDRPRPALMWEFPLVEQIYGPNRLHWRDLRSPDYDPAPEAAHKLVVPS